MPKIAAGATNKNISIAPSGTGKVVVGTGAADATLQSDGEHNLILQTGNSTTGKIEIADGANGNIAITPNGTGEVDISKVDIDGGAIDATDVTVGSGKTLDVSAGTLTTSTVQKQAIVDGATILSPVLQVVSLNKTDEVSAAITSNTLTKVVDAGANEDYKLSITITTGNKVLCIMSGGGRVYGNNSDGSVGGGVGIIRVVSGETDVNIYDTNSIAGLMMLDVSGYEPGGTSYTAFYMPFNLTILDTPGSTAPTYSLGYRRGYQTGASCSVDKPFNIILMEIQA